MNKDILSAWDNNQEKVREWISTVKTDYFTYRLLLENTIKILFGDNDTYGGMPDYKRVNEISNGSYQGTLIFIVGGKGYEPSVEDHWYTSVSYGSCTGCDTLLMISGYENKIPTEKQVQEYWTLCLHMMQKMKRMNDKDGN